MSRPFARQVFVVRCLSDSKSQGLPPTGTAKAGDFEVVADGSVVGSYSLKLIKRRTPESPYAGLMVQFSRPLLDKPELVEAISYDIVRDSPLQAIGTTVQQDVPRTIATLERAGFRWCDITSRGRKTYEMRNGINIHVPQLRIVFDESAQASKLQLFDQFRPPRVQLATSSPVKRMQYGFLFGSNGILVQSSGLKDGIPEPQVEGAGESNERILVEDPLRRLSRFAAKSRDYPVLLEDTMLFIEHFNHDYTHYPMLPGPDTKRWWAALGDQGVLNLMGATTSRRAKLVCQMGVLTADGAYHVFRAEVQGKISTKPRKISDWRDFLPYTSPFNFHTIFEPSGSDKTYAEMLPGEFRAFDYRSQCADDVSNFLLSRADMASVTQIPIFELGG